jgi:general secretion pathway protein G
MKLAVATHRASRRAAFTLLEVLVVVAIIVILAGVGVVATTRNLEDARKSRAQLACRGISNAIKSYKLNPANQNGDDPSQIGDLLTPPWGGTGFLANGQNDLKSPWNGVEYQMQKTTLGDGSEGIVVFCVAPDGTKISEFGIGPASQMQ